MTLDDYHNTGAGDLSRYFPGAVLPYTDKSGAQRMGFIESFENGKFIYHPNIKDSDQWSARTFRKSFSEFEYHHNLSGKMVQHQGGAIWVDTRGSRTTSKGIGRSHFRLVDPAGSRSLDHIQNMPSVIYPFLYQQEWVSVEEANAMIANGDANSVAVSSTCAVLVNNRFSYMGVEVSSLEGLL